MPGLPKLHDLHIAALTGPKSPRETAGIFLCIWNIAYPFENSAHPYATQPVRSPIIFIYFNILSHSQ